MARTYIHACIHTYIHTYLHACMHTHVHTYIRTRIDDDQETFPISTGGRGEKSMTRTGTMTTTGMGLQACPYIVCTYIYSVYIYIFSIYIYVLRPLRHLEDFKYMEHFHGGLAKATPLRMDSHLFYTAGRPGNNRWPSAGCLTDNVFQVE